MVTLFAEVIGSRYNIDGTGLQQTLNYLYAITPCRVLNSVTESLLFAVYALLAPKLRCEAVHFLFSFLRTSSLVVELS
jgi:hypothetical protein